MWATVLGIAIAWHALASFVADSDVIESLTDNYWRSFLISGVAVTGAFLFKAGAILYDEDAVRAYYKRLFKCAVVALLLYIIVVSATFGPHKIDPAALQLALAGEEIIKSPIAETIKEIAPYFMVGTQLLTEMLIAPLLYYYATQHNLAGREIIVETHNGQALHAAKIDELTSKIVDIAKNQAAFASELAAHVEAEALEIAAALRLYRQMEAEHARHMAHATNEFMSKQFEGA